MSVRSASATVVEDVASVSPSALSLPPPQPASVLDRAITLAARMKEGRESFDIKNFLERSKNEPE